MTTRLHNAKNVSCLFINMLYGAICTNGTSIILRTSIAVVNDRQGGWYSVFPRNVKLLTQRHTTGVPVLFYSKQFYPQWTDATRPSSCKHSSYIFVCVIQIIYFWWLNPFSYNVEMGIWVWFILRSISTFLCIHRFRIRNPLRGHYFLNEEIYIKS